jgi:hypothetical protein
LLGRNLGGFSIGSSIPLVPTPPGPEGRVILMMPTQWGATFGECAYQDIVLISSPVTLSIDGIDKSLAARPLPREEPAFFLTIDQRTVIVYLSCPATRMLLAYVHTAYYLTRLSSFLMILTACPYHFNIMSSLV